MRKIKSSLLIGLLGLMILVCGCKSPQVVAYRAVGSTAISVNTALKIYGDFYKQGKSSDEEREKIKAIYEKYQAACRVAEKMQKTITANSDSVTSYQLILLTIEATSKELIDTINTLVNKKKSTETIELFKDHYGVSCVDVNNKE